MTQHQIVDTNQTISTGPIVYGGELPSETGALSILRLIEETQSLLAENIEFVSNLKLREQIISDDIKLLETWLAQIKDNLQKNNNDKVVLTKQKEETVSDLNLAVEELKVLSSDHKRISNQYNENIKKVEELSSMLNEAIRIEDEINKILSESQTKVEQLKQNEVVLTQEYGELKTNLKVTEEKKQNWQSEYQFYLKEQQRLQNNSQRLNSEITGLQSEIDHSSQAVTKSEQLIFELDKQKQNVEQEYSKLREEINIKQNKFSDNETKLRNLRHERDTVQTNLHNIEVKISYTKGEITHVINQLKNNYNISYENVPEFIAPIVPKDGQLISLDDINNNIDRLKKRIESLGKVNLAATEEYETLQSQLNFLESQKQDLLKAKDDLMQLITKINSTTRERFKETFETVRTNFKQTFRMLFEGGEADLILTDETNLIDTGIEIVAQPPGKRLQVSSLLSGGEKALIAIALLFAFFMVKPAPFCILDEVDAALDESNVWRFTNLVKEYIKSTQFVIITHNRRTMESADVFYGITSEENGISKIVSMKYVAGDGTEKPSSAEETQKNEQEQQKDDSLINTN